MNNNELAETKARGKETSYNALAEIRGRNVDGWKKLVEIGKVMNESENSLVTELRIHFIGDSKGERAVKIEKLLFSLGQLFAG